MLGCEHAWVVMVPIAVCICARRRACTNLNLLLVSIGQWLVSVEAVWRDA